MFIFAVFFQCGRRLGKGIVKAVYIFNSRQSCKKVDNGISNKYYKAFHRRDYCIYRPCPDSGRTNSRYNYKHTGIWQFWLCIYIGKCTCTENSRHEWQQGRIYHILYVTDISPDDTRNTSGNFQPFQCRRAFHNSCNNDGIACIFMEYAHIIFNIFNVQELA